jgi:tetratricopeptide (TPR) repeat protein
VPKTKIAVVLLSAVLAVLFIRVLSLGLADHYARSHPERALFWRSSHPEALYRMAESQARTKHWPQAADYAKRAIAANRFDGRALRVLAQAEQANGNNKQALAYYQQAAQLAPRDVQAHAWLLQHALQNRNAQDAVAHLDALLRLKPALMLSLRPQANALAVNPATRAYMAKALLELPPWRRDFLAELPKAPYRSADLAPFFQQIAMRSVASADELRPWLERLRQEKRYAQAYVTWANLVPPAQQRFLGTVFDGGFEVPPENQVPPYGWSNPPITNTYMLWAGTRGSVEDSSFNVQFEGRRTPFDNLWQSILLAPGKWRLRWRAKANRLESTRGLVWRVNCESDGRILAESAPMRGQFDWRSLEMAFEIPADCAGQRLGLLIPARIPAETQINGALWLDEVRIQPDTDLP